MRKNRSRSKFLLIFLFIFLIILPLRQAEAVWGWIEELAKKIGEEMMKALTFLLEKFFRGIHLFFELLQRILAKVTNIASDLNPFPESRNRQSPAEAFFNVLATFGYILLVFLALLAAFEILFEENASASSIIFNIFIAAFLIVFAFTFVKEGFLVAKKIETQIAGAGLIKVGDFIVTTMWSSDPFDLVNKVTGDIDDEFLKSMARIGGYIFILVLDMITIILLFVTIFLLLYRYIIITFLAATSSIAIATLAIPEARGRFSQFLSGFRYFEGWFDAVVRWLLVIPVFVILIIAGNIVRENVFDQLKTSGIKTEMPAAVQAELVKITTDMPFTAQAELVKNEKSKVGFNGFVQFILIYVLLAMWYLFSINVANNLSRGVAKMATGIAVTGLSLMGGFAARRLMTASRGVVGNVLTKAGRALQKKVGVGGAFGWRSRMFQVAGSVKNIGQKMLKGREEQIEQQLNYLAGQLNQAINPQQIQRLSTQFADLIRNHQNLFAHTISTGINQMDIKGIRNIMQYNPQSLQTIAAQIRDQGIKDSFIDKLEKALDKKTLRMIMSQHPNFFEQQTFQGLDPAIQRVFADSIRTQLSESDALNLVLQTRQQMRNFHNAIRDALNRQTRGFVEAFIRRNVNQIASALADFKSDTWDQFNTIEFFRALRDQKLAGHIPGIYAAAIQNSENPLAIIRAITRNEPRRDPNAGPTRTLLNNQRGRFMPPLIRAFSNDPRMQDLIRNLFS